MVRVMGLAKWAHKHPVAFVNLRGILNLKSALYRVIIGYKRQQKFVYLLFVLRHWECNLKHDHKRNCEITDH